MSHGTFATLLTCIDGRVQQVGYEFVQKYINVDYVDVITEPGINKVLAENVLSNIIENIFKKIDISVFTHGSPCIAVAGHYDCAANPADKKEQNTQTKDAVRLLKSKYPDIEIIGLWIESDFETVEIVCG